MKASPLAFHEPFESLGSVLRVFDLPVFVEGPRNECRPDDWVIGKHPCKNACGHIGIEWRVQHVTSSLEILVSRG
jgi:hypothetical protein